MFQTTNQLRYLRYPAKHLSLSWLVDISIFRKKKNEQIKLPHPRLT